MNLRAVVVVAIVLVSPLAVAAPTVTPLHVKGSTINFPRLSGLANVAVQTKINAALAAAEKEAHQNRQDCIAYMRDSGRPGNLATWSMTIDARYVSARYVSFDIRNTYDCGGAYPTDDAPMPMTFDLTIGDPLDWTKLFKPGFVPAETNADAGHVPGLSVLYRARYAKEGGRADPQCQTAVKENLGTVIMWLDARKGLVVQPDFPHVIAACADTIAFSPAQLAPSIADAAFLADLKATIQNRPAR